MKTILQGTFVFLIAAALVATFIPTLAAYREKAKATQSLASLRLHGDAVLKIAEEDGKLPRKLWRKEALNRGYIPYLSQDPTYTEKTKALGSELSGWGVNGRLGPSLGLDQQPMWRDRELLSPAVLEPHSVIMTSSADEVFFPLRDGTIEPQDLSERDKTKTDHQKRLGRSALYFLRDGTIQQLTPQEASRLMARRSIPPSVAAALDAERAKRLAKLSLEDLKVEGDTTYHDKYVTFSKGEVESPKIPSTPGKIAKISFEIHGEIGNTFTTTLKFLNQWGDEINANNVGVETSDEPIVTQYRSKEAKEKNLLFNVRDGHGEYNPAANYAPQTAIGTKKQTRVEKSLNPGKDWDKVEIEGIVPEGAKSLAFTFSQEKESTKDTVIREIKVQIKNPEAKP